MSKSKVRDERGFILVVALFFLGILALLGATAIVVTSTDVKTGGNYAEIRRAYYNAEAGVNYVMKRMEQGLMASPQTFSLPTVIDGTVSLSTFTAPTGFNFSFSAPGLTKTSATTFSFTSVGMGLKNAKASISAVFRVQGNQPFNYGIFGGTGVTISGNGYTDSYISSTGPWTWGTHRTEGDVGTNGTQGGAIALSGNADIYGDAQIGPGGNPLTGITTSGNAEVHGQELAALELKDMTPVTGPGGGTAETLNLSGNSSKTLSAGTYQLPSINISGNANGYINGDVTLYVTGSISISGNGALTVNSGGSLKIYVSGNISISGNGMVNNTTLPANLMVFGSSSCSSVSVSGNGDLYGAVYAPLASISVTGNGDIYGSIVGRSVNISGNGNVHYDEALKAFESTGTVTGLVLLASKPQL